MVRLFFKKGQRLKRKKWIQLLFEKGRYCRKKGLVCYYLAFPEIPTHQILVGVGKKYIKKAVLRNKIKRRMREAYRLQQDKIAPDIVGGCYLMAYLFVGQKEGDYSYATLAKRMGEMMEEIPVIKPLPSLP